MRRGSLVVLIFMLLSLLVLAGLLFYIFLRSSVSDMGATGTVIPATLPVPPEQQIAPLSEPVGIPTRFVYIVSVLIVFVSAVLILFRVLLGISGKNEE